MNETTLLDLDPAWLRVSTTLLGLAWGSFLNVAIHRWPREHSVVHPPSHCPACEHPLRWYDNVPLLSFLWLRGKCRYCSAPISPRYPVVEALFALLLLALLEMLLRSPTAEAPLAHALLWLGLRAAFVGALLIATFVDLEWMIIPDETTLPVTALGLLGTAWLMPDRARSVALGAGLGFLVIQVLFVWCYERLLGRRGMGEGDAKLLMAIGAFVGWKGVVFALTAGAVQGLLVTLVTHAFSWDARAQNPLPEGRAKIPFGPFLALAALQFLFFGPRIEEAYLDLIL